MANKHIEVATSFAQDDALNSNAKTAWLADSQAACERLARDSYVLGFIAGGSAAQSELDDARADTTAVEERLDTLTERFSSKADLVTCEGMRLPSGYAEHQPIIHEAGDCPLCEVWKALSSVFAIKRVAI